MYIHVYYKKRLNIANVSQPVGERWRTIKMCSVLFIMWDTEFHKLMRKHAYIFIFSCHPANSLHIELQVCQTAGTVALVFRCTKHLPAPYFDLKKDFNFLFLILPYSFPESCQNYIQSLVAFLQTSNCPFSSSLFGSINLKKYPLTAKFRCTFAHNF